MEKKCEIKIKLKTSNDIDQSLRFFTKAMLECAKQATPTTIIRHSKDHISHSILQLLNEKRTLRRQWQLNRSPNLKAKLNKSVKTLRKALEEERENGLQKYLSEVTATETTDYSLWKAVKNLKKPNICQSPLRLPNGDWARSDKDKAETFAHHLKEVFNTNHTGTDYVPRPHVRTNKHKKLKFKTKSIKNIIDNEINIKKSPGKDNITGQMIKKLPNNSIKLLTSIFNAIMRNGYYPDAWKISQIIMVPKPGKEPTQVSSYRPISLLPVISILFEKAQSKTLETN